MNFLINITLSMREKMVLIAASDKPSILKLTSLQLILLSFNCSRSSSFESFFDKSPSEVYMAYIAAKGPIAFATSFAPWLNESHIAVNTCKYLNEKEIKWLPGRNYCGNHPHNFYVQLFAETGILGLIFGTLMFFKIIHTCHKNRNYNTFCPMSSIAYIIPLAIFFPIQQYGSFFGQWGNLFIWFSIGFALSQIQIHDNRNGWTNE